MDKTHSGLQPDLRISPKPVLAILLIYGAALFFSSAIPSDLAAQARIVFSAIPVLALVWVAWRLNNRNPRLSRWLTAGIFTVAVYLASDWMSLGDFLILAAMPVALAAALVGLLAADVAASVESALILLLPGITGASVSATTLFTALVSIWGMFAMMCAIYIPVNRISRWAWAYYQQGLRLQDEARTRKAELARALDGLAYANRQLALTNERMAALRSIAEEAHKAKTAFVAKVSHEFRTPST